MSARTAFSHVTAARLWGIPLPSEFDAGEPLHVTTRAPGTRMRGAGVVGHTVAHDAEFAVRHGFRVTGAADTWLALEPILCDVDLVAAGDHLVLTPHYPRADETRPIITLRDLLEAASLYTGRGARRLRRLASLVRDGAESRRETVLRLALRRHGLPEPDLNHEVFDEAGRFIGRADMIYPDWRVIVEYDGDHHRTDARQYDRDMLRRDAFMAAGYRFISTRAPGLAAAPTRVESALHAAGWRPTPAERSVGRQDSRMVTSR